jgi:hypothetical protein
MEIATVGSTILRWLGAALIALLVAAEMLFGALLSLLFLLLEPLEQLRQSGSLLKGFRGFSFCNSQRQCSSSPNRKAFRWLA